MRWIEGKDGIELLSIAGELEDKKPKLVHYVTVRVLRWNRPDDAVWFGPDEYTVSKVALDRARISLKAQYK